MNSSFGKRKWRCPDCHQISLVPEFEDDPVLCARCLEFTQAIAVKSPPKPIDSEATIPASLPDPNDSAFELPDVSATPKTTREGTLGCGGILVLLIIAGIGSRFLNRKNAEQAPAVPDSSSQQIVSQEYETPAGGDAGSKQSTARFVTGDIVWVQHGTFVAQTWESLKELSKAANAKDNIGVTQLWLNGSAFMVDDGPVQARILDRGILASEIRITAGRYYGRSGWVYNERLTVGADPHAKLKQEAKSIQVHRSQFGDKWPLTVEYGTIFCLGNRAVIFRAPDGKDYALNGPAIQMGYQRITPNHPIWRNGTKYGDVQTKVDLGVLTAVGLKLCQ